MANNKPFRGTGQAEEREAFRRRLFEQQSGLCHLCGKLMTLVRKRAGNVGRLFATFDHIIPHARGGNAYHTNIKLAHRACNSARNDRPVSTVDVGT